MPSSLRRRIAWKISCLAPRSMPRVGSSSSSILGFRLQPFSKHELLLVSSRQVERLGIEPLGIESKLPGERLAPHARLVAIDDRPRGHGVKIGEHEVRQRRAGQHQTLALAVFRGQHDAPPDRFTNGSWPRAIRRRQSASTPLPRARPRRCNATPRCVRRRPVLQFRGSRLDARPKERPNSRPGNASLLTCNSSSSVAWLRFLPATIWTSPSIARTSVSLVHFEALRVSTSWPSRITETRSLNFRTSSRSCEMKMIATPLSLRRPIRSYNRARSKGPSGAVGSSMMSTFWSVCTARMISIIC